MTNIAGMVVALAMVASASVHAQQAEPANAALLMPPTHFMEGGKKDAFLLSAIQHGMVRTVDFNKHFSSSVVSCGTGCASLWFVDRLTGGVIAVPESSLRNEFIQYVGSSADSDVIDVIYGPMDARAGKCSGQHYRWDGKAFAKIGARSAATCDPGLASRK